MAITLTERKDSRAFMAGAYTRRWWLKGTSDEGAALAYFQAHIPSSFGGLAIQKNLSIEPVPDSIVGSEDKGQWECSAQYGSFRFPEMAQDEIGTVRIYGDTTGAETQRIYKSIHTEEYGEAQNWGGKIGARIIGGVVEYEGVDVPRQSHRITVTKVWTKATLPDPDSFKTLLKHVNSTAFTIRDTVTGKSITFAPGECFFEGAQYGNIRGDDGMEVTYSFASCETRDVLLPLHEGNVSVSVPGWHYLWCYSHDGDWYSAYVEQVLEEADLNDLNI